VKNKAILAGVASLALAGAMGVTSLAPAAAGGLKPHISVVATGGSGPYITGSKFTPKGSVVVTEWAVGVKKPYWTTTTSADSAGDIALYDICDGNTPLRIQARDVTTHHKSNKTAPEAYLCIN
jgi:hypothetical protein